MVLVVLNFLTFLVSEWTVVLHLLGFFGSPVLILCHVFIGRIPQCQGRRTLRHVIAVVPESLANFKNRFDKLAMMSFWPVHRVYDVVFHMIKPSFRLFFRKSYQYSVWEGGKAHIRVHYFPVLELEFQTQSHPTKHLLGKRTYTITFLIM